MIKCYLSLHCSASCLVVFFRATALRSPSAQPSRHLQQRSLCDSHHGLKELFGAATFDLKPLSQTEHVQAGAMAHFSMKKLLRESELDESASPCLLTYCSAKCAG